MCAEATVSDAELVAEYVGSGSESAFRRLVERYTNMVYSTCLARLNGNTHASEDAAQAVFVILARKASSIHNRTAIGGWLFRTACSVVSHMIREESRRKVREEKSAMIQLHLAETVGSSEEARSDLMCRLYEAMATLRSGQQDVLVMHYLDRMTQKEVAKTVGCSEKAIQMKISRAVEKIRSLMSRKGTSVSAASLGVILSSEAVGAAPESLAGSCHAAAMTAVGGKLAGIGSAAAAIAQGTLRMLFWAKVKMAVATVCAIMVAGIPGGIAVAKGIVKNGETADAVQLQHAELSGPKPVVQSQSVELPDPKLEDQFRKSFFGMQYPDVAMQPDAEEQTLRNEVRDTLWEYEFLLVMSDLKLTREQMEKILPQARAVRDVAEQAALDIDTNFTKRADEILTGGKKIIASGRRIMLPSVYPQSGAFWKLRPTVREASSNITSNVLTEIQRSQLAKLKDRMNYIPLPRHCTHMIWYHAGTGKVDTFGLALMAPCAVKYFEKQLGLDTTESEKRAEKYFHAAMRADYLFVNVGNALHRRSIPVVNLANGLNLNEKQLKDIINVIHQVEKLQEAHANVNKESLRPLLKVVTEMRDLARSGRPAPRQLFEQAVSMNSNICSPANGQFDWAPHLLCSKHKAFTDKMSALARDLETKVLTETQASLVYNSSSCYFPPGYQSDPVRVGGSLLRTEYLKEQDTIVKLRALNDSEYPAQRDKFIADIMADREARRRGKKDTQASDDPCGPSTLPVTANAKSSDCSNDTARVTAQPMTKEQMIEILDRARKMSDTDFYLFKTQLAADLTGKEAPVPGYPSMRLGGEMPPYYEKPIPVEHHGWRLTMQEKVPLAFLDSELLWIYQGLLDRYNEEQKLNKKVTVAAETPQQYFDKMDKAQK